jgi:hypothetical protein
VIDEVDECLRSLLERALGDDKAAIAFDPPSAEWVAGLDGPLLDLFLYDVREELGGRTGDWEDVRDDRGVVTARRAPARRYRLSYMVSAWATCPEAEHRLLWRVLEAAPEQETIPAEFLPDRLRDQREPVTVQVAVPGPGTGVPASGLWSALGTRPRTSLEIVVLAPLAVPPAPGVSRAPRRIDLDVGREEAGRPGGRPGPDGVAVPGRVVKRRAESRINEGPARGRPGGGEPS